MNNFIVKITSPFACITKVNNIEKTLSKKTDSLILKITDEKEFTIYCYPLNPNLNEQKNIPFALNINLDDIYKNTNDQAQITLYKNNFLDINLKPFLIYKTPLIKTKKETISCKNKKHELVLSIGKPCVFSVSCDDSIHYKTLDFDCLNYKATTGKDLIFIEFIGVKNQILALKYTDKYEILDDAVINSIEYTKDKITIHQPIFDMAKHGRLIEYDLLNTNSRKASLTYNDKKPTIITNKHLVPYAFFEAVKIKNFKLARLYLTPSLSNALTDNHIEEYFKNFLEITPSPFCNIEENLICLIYKEKNIYTTREYKIELEQDKINNIILSE